VPRIAEPAAAAGEVQPVIGWIREPSA